MKEVIDFISAHPELTVLVLSLLESAVMPLIPVKWNGLAVFIFGLVKKAKTPPAPLPKQDGTKEKMEKAIEEFNKKSAEDKLV